MAGAWVQSFTFEGNDQLTSKTLAVNTDGPATANNLLVAVIVVQAGGDSFTTPTGYTLLNDYSSGAGENWGVASYYRVASGSAADDCAFAWTDAGRPQIVIQEFSGLDSSSPFEQKAEDESNVLTSVTSQGTGTATPDTANGIAVACFACEDESVWSAASTSVGGSFSNLATAGYVARSTAGMASLPYTSTAGQSATFSTSESGYVAYGSIAVFKESAAGGATAAITGTATASIDESDIVSGGKTVIITLTGDTWKAAGTGPIGTTANTQAIIDGMDSAQVEAAGWNAEVRDKEVTTAVARTSDTVATITLTAQAGYDVTAQETITVTVPTEALVTGAAQITATPTFTVDFVSAAGGPVAGSMALMGMGI